MKKAQATDKMEYGTALHLVGKGNTIEVKEFWGAHHAEQAIKELEGINTLKPQYWHNFVPLVREVPTKR